MRWNQLAEDTPRALALADILLGAGHADSNLETDEKIILGAMLMKVLGVTELPAEVKAHMDAFHPDQLNLVDACARLGLATERDKKSLLKVVADIVKADATIDKAEKGYVQRLGKALGLAAADVKAALA